MRRRTFLRGAVLGGGAAVLSGSLWRGAAGVDIGAQPGPGPYGALLAPDGNGVALPAGFSSRVVARSGQLVPGSVYPWHPAPDGAACFADGAGWLYVSNSEVPHLGGVGALRFGADGAVTGGHALLTGSDNNCSGGPTPWGTWLSCEETGHGVVWETYPQGGTAAVRREALGRFKHEAAAVDPVRMCVYLTEDEPDGCFYRFVPTTWPDLAAGRLDVLCREAGKVVWAAVPDPNGKPTPTRRQVPDAIRFPGGEGCVYGADSVWFTTKGDGRVWRLDPRDDTLTLVYDDSLVVGPAPLRGVDNITRSVAGDLFVAEEGARMEVCMITPDGVVASFLRVDGHSESEVTGPAFSPDGSRFYFSSQRGTTGRTGDGVTFEVTGPFRR